MADLGGTLGHSLPAWGWTSYPSVKWSGWWYQQPCLTGPMGGLNEIVETHLHLAPSRKSHTVATLELTVTISSLPGLQWMLQVRALQTSGAGPAWPHPSTSDL